MGKPIGDRSSAVVAQRQPIELLRELAAASGGATDAWVIDCANCGHTFTTTRFDADAFCTPRCHGAARAVRYGRKQAGRFGQSGRWRDDVLAEAVARVPDGVELSEIRRRWNAEPPERGCDDDLWNETWQQWIARHRRQRPLTVPLRATQPNNDLNAPSSTPHHRATDTHCTVHMPDTREPQSPRVPEAAARPKHQGPSMTRKDRSRECLIRGHGQTEDRFSTVLLAASPGDGPRHSSGTDRLVAS
jgi:hypothetical protein